MRVLDVVPEWRLEDAVLGHLEALLGNPNSLILVHNGVREYGGRVHCAGLKVGRVPLDNFVRLQNRILKVYLAVVVAPSHDEWRLSERTVGEILRIQEI